MSVYELSIDIELLSELCQIIYSLETPTFIRRIYPTTAGNRSKDRISSSYIKIYLDIPIFLRSHSYLKRCVGRSYKVGSSYRCNFTIRIIFETLEVGFPRASARPSVRGSVYTILWLIRSYMN